MRYVYIGGEYTQFRGYVFVRGKPTTILDKGTLVALAQRPDFKEVKDEPQEEVRAPAQAPVLSAQGRNPDACPKCGRVVKQGKYMHIKYCDGKAP